MMSMNRFQFGVIYVCKQRATNCSTFDSSTQNPSVANSLKTLWFISVVVSFLLTTAVFPTGVNVRLCGNNVNKWCCLSVAFWGFDSLYVKA